MNILFSCNYQTTVSVCFWFLHAMLRFQCYAFETCFLPNNPQDKNRIIKTKYIPGIRKFDHGTLPVSLIALARFLTLERCTNLGLSVLRKTRYCCGPGY